MQLHALDGERAAAEPKRMRLHPFTTAGQFVRTACRLIAGWPWATDIRRGSHRLHAFAPG